MIRIYEEAANIASVAIKFFRNFILEQFEY